MSDPYSTGDVLDYPYLWDWQYQRGETEGHKDRPCCVTLVVPLENGQTRLCLLPITTTEPTQCEPSLEVPEIEAKRAGLLSRAVTTPEHKIQDSPGSVLLS